MSELAVFAYGSLVNATSFSQTLGRPVGGAIPARLHGWRRTWGLARRNGASEKTFALADGTLPRYCLGVDVAPDDGAPAPNGALVALTATELERLDLREMRYDRIEVTEWIDADITFDRIVTYRAKPEHRCGQPPPGAVIIAAYLTAVEAAFEALGPGELERFRATTGAPPVDIVEASLVADRIPAGNPRDW